MLGSSGSKTRAWEPLAQRVNDCNRLAAQCYDMMLLYPGATLCSRSRSMCSQLAFRCLAATIWPVNVD